MTRESAALLAQVVPIMALGLGIELRLLGPQLVRLAEARVDAPVRLFRLFYGLIAMVPAVLAATEIRAIYIALGPGEWTEKWGTFLFVSIVFIFIAPAVQATFYYFESLDAAARTFAVRTHLLVILPSNIVLFVSTLLII